VSAAVGRDVWQNTTKLICFSPFEYYNIENHPRVTLHTHHVPQTFKSVVSNQRATRTPYITSAPAVTTSTTITPKAPSPLTTSRIRLLPDATKVDYATGHTKFTSTNFKVWLSAYPHSYATHNLLSTNLGDDMISASGNASIKQTSEIADPNMSAMSPPTTVTVFSPNTTSSEHTPINHANTTIVVWTGLSSATTTPTPTPTPKPRDTSFRHFISSASPYLEACSFLVVVWGVGKFACAKILRYRGQRSNLPVIEES
jgi:hypothetical protein